MNEEMATTGFTGGDTATGPTAGFDPVMKQKIRRKDLKGLVAPGNKLKAGGKTVKESKVDRYAPKSHLFQYKVSLPEVGETIVYASNPAELRMKLRLLINYRYRGDIKIERIMPGDSAKFFMDKRMKHMKNVSETTDEKQMQNQLTRQKHHLEKKKANLKINTIRKQLQKKTQQLKAKGRVGGNTQDYNK
tara:strand:+ start:92 stop:661 length:570 start_codon:yes stop_codon:yes gene_type:complete